MLSNKFISMSKIITLIIYSTAIIGIIGCIDTPTEVEDYNAEPMLSAFLVNGQLFEEAWLERGSPIGAYYDMQNTGIDDATMIITSTSGDTLNLVPDPNKKGRYIPADGESLIPQGLQTYMIEAWTTPPHNEYMWAEALVPGGIEDHGPMTVFLVSDDLQDTTNVADGDTLNRNMDTMVWAWSDIDSVGGFQGVIIAQNPRDELIPLDPDWDPNDPDDELEDEDRERAGWTFMRHDQRQISIAWIFFEWEGPQKVQFNALSEDYYNFLFSTMQVDFGSIERPDFNMKGGLGIFGAYSEQIINIYMEKIEVE